MKFYSSLAKKRILANKTEALALIVAITFATAALLTALSLSMNYIVFFFTEADDLTGRTQSQLISSNLSNLAEIGDYLGEFAIYLNSVPQVAYGLGPNESGVEELPASDNSGAIFSPASSVENLLSTTALLLILVLITVNISLSIVFRVCKESRRGFLTTLLASGATIKGIKKYTDRETLYYLAASIPIGLAIGCIQIYATRIIGKEIFMFRQFSVFPVKINISLIATVLTVLIIFLLVHKFSRKVYKKLSIKSIGSDIKTKSAPHIGICVMSVNKKRYRRKGIEHFVAVRNFQSNLGRYAGMVAMSTISITILTLTIMILDAMRSYNKQEIFGLGRDMYEFSFALEVYFLSVTGSLALITFIAVFCSVTANINSNMGEYSLMRSSGSSVNAVLRAVRKEGYIASVFCVGMSLLSATIITVMIPRIYRNDPRVDFSDGWNLFYIVISVIGLFAISVISSMLIASKKMKKLDMIGTLKNLFY